MPDAFDHCEEQVRAGDKDRFLATLFAPQKHRRALYALYAFNIEIKHVRDRAHQPMPGEIRLQWWRDALNGLGRGDVASHPVAMAFRETVVRYQLPPAAILDMIDAHTFDLYDEPMSSREELEAYAARTAGTVFESACRILGGRPTEKVVNIARFAGHAETIVGLLAELPRHATRRQLYMPIDVMDECGARAEDILAGRTTDQLRKALEVMREWGRRYLLVVASELWQAPPDILPAFLPLAPARPFLLRMYRRNYDPFQPPLLPAWRSQWYIWRASKRPGLIGTD